MAGLGKRHLTEEEFDQWRILGRASTHAYIIAQYLQEEGDTALMLDVHKQADQALVTLAKGNLSDNELLSSVVSVAQSIMTALESSSRKADNYYLRDIVRGDHENPANKSKYMREINEKFTQATPYVLATILCEIEDVKHACGAPGAARLEFGIC